MCVVCGADPAGEPIVPVRQPTNTPGEETIIDGWHAVTRMACGDDPWEKFVVRRSDRESQALLTLYRPGHEPDPRVQEALRRISAGRIPKLLSTGHYEGSTYEVIETIDGGTLEETGAIAAGNTDMLRRMVECLGLVLSEFSEIGLRHRDLRPGNILLRSSEPLELAVTGFGSARLSDFDLESAAPRNSVVTRRLKRLSARSVRHPTGGAWGWSRWSRRPPAPVLRGPMKRPSKFTS
jgi:primosomal replication protein N''